MPNGKLLVLDGLDGSGKSTQFELLQTALQKQGVSIQAVSFPDYDSPSAALVKMYLNGELSNTPDGVNAYAASSFYAVDRYANYHLHWEQAYHNGTCILASRYTTSNAIYQMGKLPKSEWDNYLQWLAEYEYGRLELPEPDTVIYLDYGSKEAGNNKYAKRAKESFWNCIDVLKSRPINLNVHVIQGGEHNEASWEKRVSVFVEMFLRG